MKILAIDDNLDITELLKMTLEAMGHQVHVTNDPKQGVELVLNNSFDAVLLDLAMPGYSGIDVLDAIDREGSISDHKIVLFTASSVSDSEISKLMDRGVAGCIKKPIEIEDLEEQLRKLV